MKLMRIIATFVFIISTLVVGTFVFSINAIAADARTYNPGRIIDDVVFTDKNSMTVQQIQNFLNSKTVCDTYGIKTSELGGGTRAQWLAASGISTPITCLRDFYENPLNNENNYGRAIPAGAISAAQIIYNYSQQFSINPKVILVTLQKENGLVTDEWPTPLQFTQAMGFGCPDNIAPGAPACDPSYGSFSAQIYQAARHFRGFFNASPGWYIPFTTGNNFVRWSPNVSCGGSTVDIENRSTVALYSYTPYQPNQAAKNAQYGTGDACSAYGNRNFYMFFNDWFGQTVGTQDLVTDGVSGIYYVSNNYKYYVASMTDFYNYGYKDSDVARINRISTSQLNQIPINSSMSHISVVVASLEQGIYLISNGIRHYIPSMSLLHSYGFTDSDIMLISEASMNRYRLAANNLNSFISDDAGFAYKVEDGTRRGIYQPRILNEYPESAQANQLSWTVLDKIAVGVPITRGKLTLTSSNKIYIVVNDKWFYIGDRSVGDCIGSEGVVTIDPRKAIAAVPTTTISSCFVKDENDNKFLLDRTLKYEIYDNNQISYSSINSADGVMNMTTEPYSKHKNIVANTNGIYEIQEGLARHIMSMDYVIETTGTNSVRLLTVNSIGKLTKGANLYKTGTVIAGPVQGINLVVEGKVQYISSTGLFYAYGLDLGRVVNVGDVEINKQPRLANLPGVKVRCSGVGYIVSGGVKYLVEEPIIGEFGGINSFSDINCKVLALLGNRTMTRYVTSPGNQNTYYVDGGQLRYIQAWQTLLDLGGNLNSITTLDKFTLDSFPRGSNI